VTLYNSATLASAFLTPEGLSAVLLRQAVGGVFSLALCEDIIAETEHTLTIYHRIRRRYPYTNDDIAAFGQMLRGRFPPLGDLPQLTRVSRDPKDDMIIACALKARAQYIVTRDDDLLSLGIYRRIQMITPEAFSNLLRQRRRRPPRR